jgi:hypothetical protein
MLGSLGPVFAAHMTTEEEVTDFLRNEFDKEELSRITKDSIQPKMVAGWPVDLDRVELCLSQILFRRMLCLKLGSKEDVPGNGVWIDAFRHCPLTREQARVRGLDSDEIYNVEHYTDDDCREAMKVIESEIAKIEGQLGGFLYLNQNEAALRVEEVDSMVEYLLQRGTGWKVVKKFSGNLEALRLKLSDGKFRVILVHRPPCGQGAIKRGDDIKKKLSSMYGTTLSNLSLIKLSKVLVQKNDTLDLGNFLDENLYGDNAYGFVKLVSLTMNCHIPPDVASMLSKAMMEPDTDLLSPKNNIVGPGSFLISDDSLLFSPTHRQQDLYRAKVGHGGEDDSDEQKQNREEQREYERQKYAKTTAEYELLKKKKLAGGELTNDEMMKIKKVEDAKEKKGAYQRQWRADNPNYDRQKYRDKVGYGDENDSDEQKRNREEQRANDRQKYRERVECGDKSDSDEQKRNREEQRANDRQKYRDKVGYGVENDSDEQKRKREEQNEYKRAYREERRRMNKSAKDRKILADAMISLKKYNDCGRNLDDNFSLSANVLKPLVRYIIKVENRDGPDPLPQSRTKMLARFEECKLKDDNGNVNLNLYF